MAELTPDTWQEMEEAYRVIARGAPGSRVSTPRYEITRVDGAVAIHIPDPMHRLADPNADRPPAELPAAPADPPPANGGARTRPRAGAPSA